MIRAFNALTRWESGTCINLNRFNRSRRWSILFGWVSRAGDGWFWYGLLLIIALMGGGSGGVIALWMAGCGLACTVIYKALKQGTKRPRPCAVQASMTLTVSPLDVFSFPSGHTLHAVAFSSVATAFFPMVGLVLWPFTILVAMSRLVLGMHYPSDVVAGALIGAGVAQVTIVFAQSTCIASGVP